MSSGLRKLELEKLVDMQPDGVPHCLSHTRLSGMVNMLMSTPPAVTETLLYTTL